MLAHLNDHHFPTSRPDPGQPRPRRTRSRSRRPDEKFYKLAEVIRQLQKLSGLDMTAHARELAASIEGQGAAPLAWGLASVTDGQIRGLLMAHPVGFVNQTISLTSTNSQPTYLPWCWAHGRYEARMSSGAVGNLWPARHLPIQGIVSIRLVAGPRGSMVAVDTTSGQALDADITRARASAIGWRPEYPSMVFEAVWVTRHRSDGPRQGLELVGRQRCHPMRSIS